MKEFAIIGAGPAGLAAAYDLAKRGRPCTVFEKDTVVGGLSKTVNHCGYRFDIGGHRFFTKSAEVEALWREVLHDDFLRRPRLSRIYYRNKFFNYPLKVGNALRGLGVVDSTRVLATYLYRRLLPRCPERTFEDWVTNRFGDALFSVFFKTYTEKVWGIPCTELSADWAAQRIRNLSLGRVVLQALGIGRGRSVASLIDEFDYPRFGPGQMYETMASKACGLGAELKLSSEITAVHHSDGCIRQLVCADAGATSAVPVEQVISSMPLSDLVLQLQPAAPDEIRRAAEGLTYRSIITVNFVVEEPDLLPDTWVYVHSPEIAAGRIQFFKNWSPYMVPDPAMSTVGLEYFATEGDEVWGLDDQTLTERARDDLRRMRLFSLDKIRDTVVCRYAKAYPVYDGNYRERVSAIRQHLARFNNLACIGRYGQFRYNNMDHSIMSALLGVRRLLGEAVDPWSVNEEAQYLETREETP